MVNWDLLFMLIGVGYSCYVALHLMLKLDYQVKRKKRRNQVVSVFRSKKE